MTPHLQKNNLLLDVGVSRYTGNDQNRDIKNGILYRDEDNTQCACVLRKIVNCRVSSPDCQILKLWIGSSGGHKSN